MDGCAQHDGRFFHTFLQAGDNPSDMMDVQENLIEEASVGVKTKYSINLEARFGPLELIDVQKLVDACKEPWHNQTLCKVNESVVRLGVLQGEFHWHKHDLEDEFFYVIEGRFLIDLEGRTVELLPKQGFVVPKGVMHRTRAPERTVVLMMESAGLIPTGD